MSQVYYCPSQAVLSAAADIARAHGARYVAPEHLVLGLLQRDDRQVSEVLRALDVSPEQLSWRAKEAIVIGGAKSRRTLPPLSVGALEVIRIAADIAGRHGQRLVMPCHILFGTIFEMHERGVDIASVGLDPERLEHELARSDVFH